MSTWTPFLIIGITAGSVYAITGMGLVLSYRTSGIFNFSYGAMAAGAAYLYYELHTRMGLPSWLSLILVLFVAGPLFGLGFEIIGRGLDGVSTTAKIVATVGILLGIEALIVVVFGAQGKPFPTFLPRGTYSLSGVRVGIDQTITITVGVASMSALYAFLRWTRLGVAMRAVVESSELIGLNGISANAIRSVASIIGATFAAMAGLLLAPTTGLDPLILTLLVVQAFSSAAVGAFSSLPLTYLGGIAVGIAYALADKLAAGPASHVQWVQGLPASTPFIVLFLVLLLSPPGRLREVGLEGSQERTYRAPGSPVVRRAGILASLAVVAAVPWIVGVRLPIYTSALALTIVFGSLSLLVRTSGQISLAHYGFAAVGGAAMAHLAHGAHVPWLVALLLSGAIAVPVGVLLAVPAIRLSGLYLALATFGFGILLANLVYPVHFMFGPFGSLHVPRPKLLFIDGSDPRTFYYVVAGIAGLTLASIVVIERSRLGRILRGLADSPRALTVRGTSVNATRAVVFGISAFFAAVGGAAYASSVGFVSTSSYPWLNSLVMLAVLFMVGHGTVRAPLLAAWAFVVVPSYVTDAKLVESFPILFGVSAVLVSMNAFDTSRLKGALARKAESWAQRSEVSPALSRVPFLQERTAGLAASTAVAGRER